jgi:catechol 2,3-dioxygenase-like lactoylglutathione lyase family enzyme
MGFDCGITFCYTRDLEATAEFYETVIGLELALDQGGCRIYRVASNSYLGFCQRDSDPGRDGIILTLVTDDVDGWYERLREHGVSIEQEPRRNPDYLIYHFFFRDPSGYLLEIQRFENPKWPG